MSIVHELLAIYGALDELVVAAGPDSETAAIIERYLPGTTGVNAGYFAEIRNFLDVPEGTLPPFENVALSINAIVDSQERSEPEPLTVSEVSRLAFVIGVFSRLPDTGQIASAALKRGLELAVPQASLNEEEIASALFDLLQDRFTDRDEWPSVMSYAAAEEMVDPLVAVVPLCRTRIKRAHGETCVVLTTDFTLEANSTAVPNVPSLDELRAVVDPLNWHRCLPFFCDMKALTNPKRPDGWSRVLEITSTTCKFAYTPRMKTPIKYWKGPADDGSGLGVPLVAWVNYELDDTAGAAQQGDGLVTVDEGFIKMYALSVNSGAPGIRVVTKKVVAFRYLSEVAIAILACVSGYGNQGMDMLLNGIRNRAAANDASAWTDWEASKASASGSGGGSAGEPVEESADDVSVPTDPTRPSRIAVQVAVDMATACVDEFSAKSTAIAGKWADGKMPIPESMALSAEFTARLLTDPWRYWERLRDTHRGEK